MLKSVGMSDLRVLSYPYTYAILASGESGKKVYHIFHSRNG